MRLEAGTSDKHDGTQSRQGSALGRAQVGEAVGCTVAVGNEACACWGLMVATEKRGSELTGGGQGQRCCGNGSVQEQAERQEGQEGQEASGKGANNVAGGRR